MAQPREIKTKLDNGGCTRPGSMSGWLQGKHTYLWFGDEDKRPTGTLAEYKLYRLAKAIVRAFESED